VADHYRKGRAFIAGDAAHTHPPYGGFGLNSGLEDVTNLGWKLAASLQGWGGERLLESYGEERRPIFVETGEAVIAGGIEADRVFLERYRPERDREEFEQAWKQMGTGGGSRVQLYEPHYEGSSVVVGPPGAVCSIHGKHSFVARPGHHLAPRSLSTGRDVFEELGKDFTLLAFDAPDKDVRALEQAARAQGVPLNAIRDTFADGREAYEARLVLVRPDQYVVWSGDEAPGDAAQVMRTVAGNA
jgi:4-hydroxyisophthalate hydroxylase